MFNKPNKVKRYELLYSKLNVKIIIRDIPLDMAFEYFKKLKSVKSMRLFSTTLFNPKQKRISGAIFTIGR